MRIAGAPISWGVCEVPGWGLQLSVERVLAEMRSIGLRATEFGPDGYLPAEPRARARTLAAAGLESVGGFVPVVLHGTADGAADPMSGVDRALDAFVAGGASTLVLAAATGQAGYESRPELDDADWSRLLGRLDAIAGRGAERGVLATLHPHVGTMVETDADVRRTLDGSSIALCLDTGHLTIGGADPVALAMEVPRRIGHVHLKDVDLRLAEAVRSRQIGYAAAVAAGLYRPLGQGAIDIAGLVRALEVSGYDGWYVLEQDTVLTSETDGAGPVEDVRASLAFLEEVGRTCTTS